MKTMIYVLVFAGLMNLVGCRDNDGSPEDENPYVEENLVCVAGYYHDGENILTSPKIACYWINGERTDLPLPAGASDSHTREVIISGGMIYVTGNYADSEGQSIPCYWTDGVRTDLPVSEGSGSCVSIVISDGKVYVSGEYYSVGKKGIIPCYWIDGQCVDLAIPEESVWGSASSITVSDGRVYVAGYHTDSPGIYGVNRSVACLWIDGERTDLSVPEGIPLAEGNSIVVSGGRSYVVGYYGHKAAMTPGPSFAFGCYWVDGERTDLPLPPESDSFFAESAKMSDGVFYVLGQYRNNNGQWVPCYWAEGERTNLTDLEVPTETIDLKVNSIAVMEGRVYFGGTYSVGFYPDKRTIPCYWTDGHRIDLPLPEGTSLAMALSVAVAAK